MERKVTSLTKQVMPLEQKLVNFEGAELLGVKANDGKVYVGVRWVCEGIGFTEGQTKAERKRIQDDQILKSSGRNFVLNGNAGKREVLAVEVDFLPLWLVKISITPNMQENQPEVARKLVAYQLRAKDVLATAFIPQADIDVSKLTPEMQMFKYVFDSVAKTQLEQAETKRELEEVKSAVSTITTGMTTVPDHTIVVARVNEYSRFIRLGHNEVYNKIYDIMKAQHGIDVKQRVENERNRINIEHFNKTGKYYAESTLRSKVNGIDVMVRVGILDKFNSILIGLLAKGKGLEFEERSTSQ